MAEARVVRAIAEIGREAWDGCFEGALETYDYLAAVEKAGLENFEWFYIAIEEGGRVVAAAPAFFTDYDLDTTLNAAGRGLIGLARRVARRAFMVRLAGLGSPCTDTVNIGFAPELAPETRAASLNLLINAFVAAARQERAGLWAIKDAPRSERALWSAALESKGFVRVDGMASAELPIDFKDLDGYLARLGRQTRKDMRRKLKSLPALRIEAVHDLGGLEPQIEALYRDTRARADLQFETLTSAYFTEVLKAMPGRSLVTLYWSSESLIGFNLLLHDEQTLLDKFFCMDAAEGRLHNLYFVSWFANVRLCLERGLTCYRSGQAEYGPKLKLGSRLLAADMYVRHRSPIINLPFRIAAPLFSAPLSPTEGATKPAPSASRPKLARALVWLAMPMLAVLNQTCAEELARRLGSRPFGSDWFAALLRSPWLAAWVALEGLTLCAWMLVLTELAIGEAFLMTALGYVLVIGLGWTIFGETATPIQLIAGATILAGVWLVGSSAKDKQ